MLKHTEFEINPFESDFLSSITPLPSGISWASDPPPRNFQFPPWWGYGYFQEPHNIGFWGRSLKMA